MIFVDTCVWIDLLKNKETFATDYYIQNPSEVYCLNGIVCFEVLRGISKLSERDALKLKFNKMNWLSFDQEDYSEILNLYSKAKKQGITNENVGDWLILKTILENDATLLSSDKDFIHLNKIIPFQMIKPV